MNRNILKTMFVGLINEAYPFALLVGVYFLIRACSV